MEELLSNEPRWLPTETLRAAWESLCHDLSRLCTVRSAYADLEPSGRAHVRMTGAASVLGRIDRRVMGCLAADALYRHEPDTGETEVVLQFRHWWRESVPFLVEPAGRIHRYQYQRIPADTPPAPPEGV